MQVLNEGTPDRLRPLTFDCRNCGATFLVDEEKDIKVRRYQFDGYETIHYAVACPVCDREHPVAHEAMPDAVRERICAPFRPQWDAELRAEQRLKYAFFFGLIAIVIATIVWSNLTS